MLEPLTEREQQILACLAEGLSNQEIVNRLHLADKTVRWYNSQIYSKLGVADREEASTKARALGLLPLQKAADGKNNLPAQTMPFVGRQVELSELALLLKDPAARLLTILAPGGMGKTRLALQAVHNQIGSYADGVYFVPLTPLSSPDHMVAAIAEQIGLNLYSSESPKQQLLSYLRERHMLLLLDNFEHLLEAAPLLIELFRPRRR